MPGSPGKANAWTINRLIGGSIAALLVTTMVPLDAGAAPAQNVGVAAGAMPGLQAGSLTLPVSDTATGVKPAYCNPDPPDYAGCTYAQMVPATVSRFNAELTGSAAIGYDYYRMGQHHRHHVVNTISAALNAHLTSVYHSSVVRYHTNTGRYPMFQHWAVGSVTGTVFPAVFISRFLLLASGRRR